jgi:hypothetical protein
MDAHNVRLDMCSDDSRIEPRAEVRIEPTGGSVCVEATNLPNATLYKAPYYITDDDLGIVVCQLMRWEAALKTRLCRLSQELRIRSTRADVCQPSLNPHPSDQDPKAGRGFGPRVG